MLAKGNSKLGRSIYTFSIPAGATCPGKSELCNQRCYAQKGFFTFGNVKLILQANLDSTYKSDFVDKINHEIANKKVRRLRIHVAGDFYSPTYVNKWIEICRSNPHTIFFLYTRSWRLPDIYAQLKQLAKLPNVRTWFSIDLETGLPDKKPKNVRLAYMSIANDDVPYKNAALVFRDKPARSSIQKRMNGVLVCPVENGVNTNLTCEKCQICLSTKVPSKKLSVSTNQRIPLNLVA